MCRFAQGMRQCSCEGLGGAQVCSLTRLPDFVSCQSCLYEPVTCAFGSWCVGEGSAGAVLKFFIILKKGPMFLCYWAPRTILATPFIHCKLASSSTAPAVFFSPCP